MDNYSAIQLRRTTVMQRSDPSPRPDDQEQDQQGAPAPLTQQDSRPGSSSLIKWLVVAVAVIVVGAGAWYAWGYFATKGTIRAIDEAINTQEAPGAAAPERRDDLTLDNATPEEFYDDANFTDEERVNWAYEQLNQPSTEAGLEGMTVLEAAYKQLKEHYNRPGGREYVKELVEPSENMTGNQILVLQSTLGQLLAASSLPENERVKLLAAVVDNSYSGFEMLAGYVKKRDVDQLRGTSEVAVSAINYRPVESPIFRHYVLDNGYDPAGTPSKLMNVNGTTGASVSLQVLYKFVDGKPILIKSVPSDDPTQRASNPQNIPYEPS